MGELADLGKLLVAMQLLLGSWAACEDKPRITGMIDGDVPHTDGLPKVVQIYFPCPVKEEDATYTLSIIDRGETAVMDGESVELKNLSGKIGKEGGGFVYASPEADVFEKFMGFPPDYVKTGFYPRGQGSIMLMQGDEKNIVDVYGAPSASEEDRAAWDYTKGEVARKYGTAPITDPSDTAGVDRWSIVKGTAAGVVGVAHLNATHIVEVETCSTLACPEPGGHKDSMANNTCSKRSCSLENDCEVCCIATACNNTPSSPSSPSSPSLPSKGQDCSLVSCPVGYVIRRSPADIPCTGGLCTGEDLVTCCHEATTYPPSPLDPYATTTTAQAAKAGSIGKAASLQVDEFASGTASLATVLLAASAVGGLLALAKAAHRQRCPSPPDDLYQQAMVSEEQVAAPGGGSRSDSCDA